MGAIIEVIFWVSLSILCYAYIGYGALLFILVKLKRRISHVTSQQASRHLPKVTILIAAYNERDFIKSKIINTLALSYPKELISYIVITDGSQDGTPEIATQFPQIQVLHQDIRQGKIAAINRAMAYVQTELVIFTDANTLLNKSSIQNIVRHFSNPKVGAVAGEKRIKAKGKDSATGAGEGFYWRYESQLKKWDSEFYTVVGAAGELYGIRTSLYERIPEDTIIEDFYLTLRIAQKGYRVIYEPEAFAVESASLSVNEERKRKVRIASGGIQAIVRLKALLNPFKYKWLTFQYVSHRVLRWTLAPAVLPILFLTNLFLMSTYDHIYTFIFILHILFYFWGGLGHLVDDQKIKLKILFIPYYFLTMNLAVYLGFLKYIRGDHSVLWEKAQREK